MFEYFYTYNIYIYIYIVPVTYPVSWTSSAKRSETYSIKHHANKHAICFILCQRLQEIDRNACSLPALIHSHTL